RGALRLWQLARLVAQVAEAVLQMQRHRVVDRRADGLALEVCLQRVAALDPYRVLMKDGLVAGVHDRGLQRGQVGQSLGVIGRDLASPPGPGHEMGQLREQHRCLHGIEPGVGTHLVVMVLLGAAVQSQLAQALRDSSVRSNHHPAIAPGTEILTRKERKAGHPAQLAGHAPLAVDLAACPDRLSGVLDDLHIARPRQRQQPLQRGHLPVQVHRHDRPGARGQRRSDGCRAGSTSSRMARYCATRSNSGTFTWSVSFEGATIYPGRRGEAISRSAPFDSSYVAPQAAHSLRAPTTTSRSPHWHIHPTRRAGTPSIRPKAGTSAVTTAPAPMKAYSPKVTPHTIVALAPIELPRFTRVGRYACLRETWARGFTTLVNTHDGPQNTSSSSTTPS